MDGNRIVKLALIVGFGGVGVAVSAALQESAHGYELSLLGSTPMLFWVGVIAALIISIGVSMISADYYRLALAIGGVAMFSIVSLPLIRGYYFYGEADPMTHLGYLRDISSGQFDPIFNMYPGTHYLAWTISEITNLSQRMGLMIVTSVFTLCWMVTIPLLIKQLSGGDWSQPQTVIATVSGFVFLPVNPITTHLRTHPSTFAVLFIPVVLLLFFKFWNRPLSSWHYLTLSTMIVATIIIHPQQALSLLLLLVMIIGLSSFGFSSSISKSSKLSRGAASILLTGVVLSVWLLYSARFEMAIGSITARILSASVESGVASRQDSLSSLGVSLVELAVKIGFPIAVFGVSTLIALFAWFRSDVDQRVAPFAIASVPILGFIVVFIAVGQPNQFFRYVAFLMIPGTVLGAIGLGYGAEIISHRAGRPIAYAAVSSILCVVLITSLPLLFVDPYVAKPNFQVTESVYDGHKTIFDHSSEDIEYLSIRVPTERYQHAISGSVSNKEVETESPPDHFNNQSLPSRYDSERYLIVTNADYKRDADLYGGFRFSHEDFDYLNQANNIHSVYNNGGMTQYLITNNDTR